ncbi:MAG: preprotein translocase subunit SecE [Gammaproteobacteria bacterium]|nr:MAG: preprotein translocase subunit SecE [Gammaproteobacteria bacterium]PIE37491.1 MAG: preprotein translocase subunit SecE [Gammaproteobacteria bacterium]
MNSEAQTPNRSDGVMWALVAIIVALGVWGNSYFASDVTFTLMGETYHVAAVSLLYRVLVLLALAALAGFLALKTAKGESFWELIKGSRNEIRKVVWPTRQESTQTTLIVVAFVIVVALLLWGLDGLLSWLISMVIG